MLNEPHYPSKWSVAFVFFFIALLIAGIFAWAFYINFGTLHASADRNFTVLVDGQTYSCLKACDISLPPNVYDVLARSEGYYGQTFTVNIKRWDTFDAPLSFQLIPFLRQSQPPAGLENPSVFFRTLSGRQNLMMRTSDGERVVTEFESLVSPDVQFSEKNAVVVDEGRAFFVELETGRKIRRFDDSVRVQSSLISDNGKKVLFFVELEDRPYIWIWDNDTSELTPLSWYEPRERVQWDLGQDHRIFVVTDQLSDPSESTLLDQLTEESSPQKVLGLFQYNFDLEQSKLIAPLVEKIPQAFLRNMEQYYLQYGDGSYEELVVK